MPYMMLIVEPTGQRSERTLEEGKEAYASMLRYGDTLRKRGVLRGVESLASQAEGARVQVREGRRTVVDGPFAEAKEMIGGFFLLDCETLDEAVAIAAECPAAAWCSVEVRKIGPCWQ
ncbi:MAG: YciI family protein [Caldimonas sp.]